MAQDGAAKVWEDAAKIFETLGAMTVQHMKDQPQTRLDQSRLKGLKGLTKGKMRKAIAESISNAEKHSSAEKIQLRDLDDTVSATGFSSGPSSNSKGSLFAVACINGKLNIYDSITGFLLCEHTLRSPCSALCFLVPSITQDGIRFAGTSCSRSASIGQDGTKMRPKGEREHELMLLADFSGKVTVYTLDKADGAEAGAAFMSLQGSDPEQKTSKQAQVRDRLELRELTSYSWGGAQIADMACSDWLYDAHVARVVVVGNGADSCVLELLCELDAHRGIARVRLEERMRLKAYSNVFAASIDARGEIVATGGENKILQVWHSGFAMRRSQEGEVLPELLLQTTAAIHGVSISPDGSTLAVGTTTHAEVYELSQTKLYQTFKERQLEVGQDVLDRFTTLRKDTSWSRRNLLSRSLTHARVRPQRTGASAIGDETISDDTVQPDPDPQVQAAVRIQAIQRGRMDRRRQAKKQLMTCDRGTASILGHSALPTLPPILPGATDPTGQQVVVAKGWSQQERHAAVLIQACVRGRVSRVKVQDNSFHKRVLHGGASGASSGLRGAGRTNLKFWKDPLYECRPLIYLKDVNADRGAVILHDAAAGARSQMLAVGGGDEIWLIDVRTGAVHHNEKRHARVNTLSMIDNDDGIFLLDGGFDRQVTFRKTGHGCRLFAYPREGQESTRVKAVSLSADASILAVAYEKDAMHADTGCGGLEVHETKYSRLLFSRNYPLPLWAVALSPDAKLLACGGNGGRYV